MALYKGIEFPDQVAPFARHMPALNDHREALAALGATWDTLGLLAHLSNLKADMHEVRSGFARLAAELLGSLAVETLARATAVLGRQARIAVDVLARDLAGRGPGLAVLAADELVVEASATRAPALLDALRDRLRAFATLYPACRDLVLLAPDGEVLARLRDGLAGRSQSTLVARAMGSARTVETYEPFDVFGDAPALAWAARVEHGGRVAGVLALAFDLEREAARIFEALAAHDEVLAYVDADGRVVVSNDARRLPPGRRVALVPGSAALRLAGTACVAAQRMPATATGPAEAWPRWGAVAIAPVELAFGLDAAGDDGAAFAGPSFSGEGVFSPRLREVPERARDIQRRLDRMVWNGRIHQAAGVQVSAEASAFSRSLLGEIAATGRRTKDVFERASDELLAGVAAGLQAEARFLAGWAIEFLARELRERCADARWWAHSAALASMQPERVRPALARLQRLYPAWSELVVFDDGGRVVAATRHAGLEGTTPPDGWVADALALREPGRCVTTGFAASALADGAPTCNVAAPLLAGGRAAGGLGLVLDAKPRLESILRQSLPEAPGAVAAFCRPDGVVIARTGELPVALPESVLVLAPGHAWAGVLGEDGRCFGAGAAALAQALGAGPAAQGAAVVGVVIVPCGTPVAPAVDALPEIPSVDDGAEIATFLVGHRLLGVPAAAVVECIEVAAAVRVWRGGFAQRHAGYATWNDAALPLVDIAADVEAGPGVVHRHAIVMRSGGQEFGLLVSELGPVARMRLSEERGPAGGGDASRLIAQLARAGSVMLPVLAPEAVSGMGRGWI
ncbi:MAG: chemotaxis protein CheW [Burkholderiaceae bacterium]